jgi:hypothetical protein
MEKAEETGIMGSRQRWQRVKERKTGDGVRAGH